jgi:signal transduction histidine kinase
MPSENFHNDTPPALPAPSPTSVLIRTTRRDETAEVDGMDAAFAVTRLGGLVHELANLLDGSKRHLDLARRDVAAPVGAAPPVLSGPKIVAPPGAPVGPACAPTVVPEPEPAPASDLSRRLDVVGRAMEQMSCVVKRVLAGIAPDAGAGASAGAWAAWSLAEAIEHAAEVLRPLASEHDTDITTAVDPRLEMAPAGSIYMVITAAVRNSVEAIAKRRQLAKGTSDVARGRVEIAARLDDADPQRPYIRMEIRDDGIGPPAHAGPRGEQLFSVGFTTRAGSLGIGLALAREIVRELGGTIGLTARFTPALCDGSRGAILSVSYPVGPAARLGREGASG